MKLSDNVWLLAAIAIPLTVITIAFWAVWVHFTNVALPSPPVEEHSTPNILGESSFRSVFSWKNYLKTLRRNTFNSASLTKARCQSDVELGLQTLQPPASVTWSSAGTRVQADRKSSMPL